MGDKEPRVHYLCDGEKEDCRKRICYKTIGDREKACKHTKDIRHAKNFHKKLPKIPQADFWEKETASSRQTQFQN